MEREYHPFFQKDTLLKGRVYFSNYFNSVIEKGLFDACDAQALTFLISNLPVAEHGVSLFISQENIKKLRDLVPKILKDSTLRAKAPDTKSRLLYFDAIQLLLKINPSPAAKEAASHTLLMPIRDYMHPDDYLHEGQVENLFSLELPPPTELFLDKLMIHSDGKEMEIEAMILASAQQGFPMLSFLRSIEKKMDTRQGWGAPEVRKKWKKKHEWTIQLIKKIEEAKPESGIPSEATPQKALIPEGLEKHLKFASELYGVPVELDPSLDPKMAKEMIYGLVTTDGATSIKGSYIRSILLTNNEKKATLDGILKLNPIAPNFLDKIKSIVEFSKQTEEENPHQPHSTKP